MKYILVTIVSGAVSFARVKKHVSGVAKTLGDKTEIHFLMCTGDRYKNIYNSTLKSLNRCPNTKIDVNDVVLVVPMLHGFLEEYLLPSPPRQQTSVPKMTIIQDVVDAIKSANYKRVHIVDDSCVLGTELDARKTLSTDEERIVEKLVFDPLNYLNGINTEISCTHEDGKTKWIQLTDFNGVGAWFSKSNHGIEIEMMSSAFLFITLWGEISKRNGVMCVCPVCVSNLLVPHFNKIAELTIKIHDLPKSVDRMVDIEDQVDSLEIDAKLQMEAAKYKDIYDTIRSIEVCKCKEHTVWPYC